MTLTEDEQLNICEILEVDSLVLTAKLSFYSAQITPSRESRIRAQLTRWNDDGIGEDFSRIEGNVKNFGLNEDPEDAKNDVRSKLATLLFFSPEDLGSGLSADSFAIERG